MKFKDMPLHWKISFVIFFCVWGIVSFWLYYPYVPIVIEEPIKIVNTKIVPGGRIIYELKIDKRMPLAATIHKQLINHYVITYSTITGNVPVGKRIMRVDISVPPYASAGEYKLRWEGVYKPNPLREVSVVAYSEPFKIFGKCAE